MSKKMHVENLGTHKPLGSSFPKEGCGNDYHTAHKMPLVYTCGQELAMWDTYRQTMRAKKTGRVAEEIRTTQVQNIVSYLVQPWTLTNGG